MAKFDIKNIDIRSSEELVASAEKQHGFFETIEHQKIDVVEIPLSQIDSFPGHPFKVVNDEAMQELVQSIRDNGLIMPAIVRKKKDGRYELISGHRRKMACELAGLEKMAVTVKELDKNAATITMVDSNMQRESILPSEKAFAYKMKLEALNKQGKRTDLTFSQVGKKLNSYEDVAENSPDSRNQIHRYIRLTHLVPSLLKLVDQKRIAFGPAVEISYLTNAEQLAVLSAFESEETTPSLSQAQRLKKLSQEGALDEDKTFEILTEEKANQKEQIKFKVDLLKKYFPKDYSPKQMEEVMIKLLSDWQRKREQNRDAR